MWPIWLHLLKKSLMETSFFMQCGKVMISWQSHFEVIYKLNYQYYKSTKRGHFYIHNSFLWATSFFKLASACLSFSWTELQGLLRYCLIRMSIIILRHFLYLLYLCPCLDLGLFMSYLCDFFSFSSSFSLWLIA